MKFVDEYRDGRARRGLAREIALARRAGRDRADHGGLRRPHARDHRHGLEDLLPPEVEFLHGPGCPVCVIPMGRVDDAIALAERPDVTLATFGDMLRVPGGRGSLLEAKARGADVRMVYSPLDALALARAEPEREVVFFAIGFETTAPATAVTLLRARARGRRATSPSSATTSRSCRRSGRSSTRPACGSTPSSRPGHVSTVIGTEPYRFIPAEYGKPVVVAGLRAARHPPGDRDDPAPARRGPLRGREPVHARRPPRGQPARARGDRRDDGAARDLRVARARLDPVERAQLRPRVRRVGRGGAVRAAGRAGRGPEGLPVRRGARRGDQAVGVQGLRHGLHARSGRSARAWSRARAPAPRTTPTAGCAGRRSPCRRDGRAAAGPPRRVVTLAHGAGGKATRDARRGALPRGARQHAARAARRRRRRGRGTGRLAFTTDSLRRQAALLSRRRHRRARGQRHRQRPRRRRRAAALALGRRS